jgi:broad specificity phosphatase PhoE
MVRLIIVRHANDRIGDVYTFNGTINNPLSEKGVLQAKRLSDF